MEQLRNALKFIASNYSPWDLISHSELVALRSAGVRVYRLQFAGKNKQGEHVYRIPKYCKQGNRFTKLYPANRKRSRFIQEVEVIVR